MYQKIHNRQQTLEVRRQLRKKQTLQESVLWELLRGKKLGCKFRRQHGIGPYVVDFYCPEKKLVVEIGGLYHAAGNQNTLDTRRSLFFEELGLNVVRFSNLDIERNTTIVLEQIITVLGRTT